MKHIFLFFRRKDIIFLMFLINFFGTIYGYIWYSSQLSQTPKHFLPFVPDSPTASLFFLFVLFAFSLKKNWPLMEAFAAVTLIKYGIWAVAMNIGAGAMGDELTWKNYMLIFSHLGMALEAILYSPYYRIRPWHLVIVAVWTLHNDIIDYVYGMHPWVALELEPYIHHIGYFTFWLSIFSLSLVYYLSVRKNRQKLSL